MGVTGLNDGHYPPFMESVSTFIDINVICVNEMVFKCKRRGF